MGHFPGTLGERTNNSSHGEYGKAEQRLCGLQTSSDQSMFNHFESARLRKTDIILFKCDEAVPACSYCVKKKKPCSGYKDPFDLALRDQSKSAERSVQRRKRAYEVVKEPIDRSSGEMVRTSSPLREYQKDHALCFFFTEYVLILGDPQPICGYIDYVTPVFVKCESQSPVVFATQAVATSLFEAWLSKGPDTVVSPTSYLMAITTLRECVEQRKTYCVEEFLMAILLLDMYEVSSTFLTFHVVLF